MSIDPASAGAPPTGAPPVGTPPQGVTGDPSDDLLQEPAATDTPPTRSQLREVRAEARSWRLKAQEGAKAADELAKIKAANMTELERERATAAEATSRATAAELRATRLEVAYAKGLPASAAVRLQGTTREEMESDADELLKLVAAQQPGRRVSNAGQNAPGAAPGGDPSSWLRGKLAGRQT